jgi:hypothetical protein
MNLKAILFGLVVALGFEAGVSVLAQSNTVNPHDFSAFQIISDRNIFDPNRQPRVRNRTTPRPPRIVDSFSLVGTMSYSNVLLAFFDGTSSDYRKSLQPGDKIANYTAAEIRQDAVKLVSGTNAIELKVGMQMRRSADGNWAAAAASETSLAANPGSNEERGGRRFEHGNFPNASSGNSGAETPEMAGPESGPDQPPNFANLDPNDPVARLMLRRLQAEGVVPPPPAAAATNGFNAEPENTAASNPETNAHENVEIDRPQNLSPESNENRN